MDKRVRENQQGFIAVILAVVFGLFFAFATGIGIWAYSERTKYKEDTDKIVADAVTIAVQEAETAKDVEFIESEKQPYRTYTGPPTYGSVSFEYPKTWSLYEVLKESGTVVDLYGYPKIVPGVATGEIYSVRIMVSSRSYDSEVKSYESDIKKGVVKAKSFRPEKIENVLGLRLDGEIENNVQGAMVLLPLRDRTLKVYTMSPDFVKDFSGIILPSLTFIP